MADAAATFCRGPFGRRKRIHNRERPSRSMQNFDPQRPPPSPPIATEKVTFERKIFFLDLKENPRGRFLKITEDVGGRRDTIMLPAAALRTLRMRCLCLVEFESKLWNDALERAG